MPQPKQPVTDDSIQVRQLSHYQFSWIVGEPGAPGTWTLQLVLDQGAWEEVVTVDADDADNLQDMLSSPPSCTTTWVAGRSCSAPRRSGAVDPILACRCARHAPVRTRRR